MVSLVARERWDVDAVYVPEEEIDFFAECERLSNRMDEKDGVNIFLSEGAGIETIVKQKEAADEKVERDAFGHVNNAVFATYIETARGTLFERWGLPFNGKGQSLIVASITIDYLKQIKHPTRIIVGQRISRI